MDSANRGLSTRAAHGGREAGDPVEAFEARLAGLEEADRAFAFVSGAAAVSTVLELVDAGGHVVLTDDPVGPAYRVFEDVRRRAAGLRITYADFTERAALEAAIADDTRMLWVQSPGGTTLRPADLAMAAEVARERELASVCDNALATPEGQRPLALGFDIAVHGAPGYLAGDGAARIGAAAVAPGRDLVRERLAFLRRATGTAAAPADCAAALAGLAHLALRMARVRANAARLAAVLERHPAVARAAYSGLGGGLAAVLAGGTEAARALLSRAALFAPMEAPDGARSGIDHPASMSLATVPPEIRAALGAPDGFVRLWAGIEDGADLEADLVAALGP